MALAGRTVQVRVEVVHTVQVLAMEEESLELAWEEALLEPAWVEAHLGLEEVVEGCSQALAVEEALPHRVEVELANLLGTPELQGRLSIDWDP